MKKTSPAVETIDAGPLGARAHDVDEPPVRVVDAVEGEGADGDEEEDLGSGSLRDRAETGERPADGEAARVPPLVHRRHGGEEPEEPGEAFVVAQPPAAPQRGTDERDER